MSCVSVLVGLPMWFGLPVWIWTILFVVSGVMISWFHGKICQGCVEGDGGSVVDYDEVIIFKNPGGRGLNRWNMKAMVCCSSCGCVFNQNNQSYRCPHEFLDGEYKNCW